jgi:serine/threonine-protein kinase HipA
VYDALPNLFQAGRVKWDLALAVNGIFDHRRISAELILAEAHTWGVIAPARASALISETLEVLDDAITEIASPKGVSDGMIEHLQWNVRRLLAGQEISEPRA